MAEFIKIKGSGSTENYEYFVNVDEIVHVEYFKGGEHKSLTIYTKMISTDDRKSIMNVYGGEIDRVYEILKHYVVPQV